MTADQLQGLPLLLYTDSTVLSRLLAEGQIYVRHYAKGATIHNQGDVCTVLDVVLSGTLAAYSLSENGSAVAMFEFRKNSMIGANLLFGDRHVYPLNIYSTAPCQLLHITRAAVTELLHDFHFVMQYIKSLSMNSQGMNRKITMLTQKTLRENLLDYLQGQSILQNSAVIVLPISKKQLADYLGVQRPSLFRELKKLKEEGILQINQRVIRLCPRP